MIIGTVAVSKRQRYRRWHLRKRSAMTARASSEVLVLAVGRIRRCSAMTTCFCRSGIVGDGVR